jgi:hypothetical protein
VTGDDEAEQAVSDLLATADVVNDQPALMILRQLIDNDSDMRNTFR